MRVVAAACRTSTGRVWSLAAPARHYDIRKQMFADGITEEPESGFLLDDGTFVDRRRAGDEAFRSGQMKFRKHKLESIDLW